MTPAGTRPATWPAPPSCCTSGARHVTESLPGATVEVHELEGRTPLLLIDVPPTDASGAGSDDGDTVLLYGHLDKQPPFTGWREGLGPWEPVQDGDRLYGRGSADDGYSTFRPSPPWKRSTPPVAHRRCVVLIEASEESGSPDLPAHLEALGDKLGTPSLVIAPTWCGDYERLWITTSLRGLVDLTLEVQVLTEGVHSGMAAGGAVQLPHPSPTARSRSRTPPAASCSCHSCTRTSPTNG